MGNNSVTQGNINMLYTDENKALLQNDGSLGAGILIDSQNGCLNGFCMGISYRVNTDYDSMDSHEDQEGFYVLAGTGMAKVGRKEFPLHPGGRFIVPKGVLHSIKKAPGSVPVKLLYTHGAV